MKTNRVPAGRLLSAKDDVQVYELSFAPGCYATPTDFDQTVVGFSSSQVGIRVVSGRCGDTQNTQEQPQITQILLDRHAFETLISSYCAYKRAEQKQLARLSSGSLYGSAPDDGFDPFLDSDELP
jgi:hypothetical protein